MAEHDGGRRSGRNFGPQGNRKPFGDRNSRDGERRGGFGDRKPYGDRPQRDGERRPYGDRPQRDGERRWEDRGERRSFGDRPQRDGERRPYGDRKQFGDRPQRDGERRPYGDRKPFGDRPQRDGERRPYGDRPQRDGYGPRRDDRRDDRGSFGERRSFGDRPQRDGERRWEDRADRRPYGDRPQRDGERRPYGDRPQREGYGRGRDDRGSFGDRRSFGDRPQRDGERRSYGDRKSFGDRPQRDGERRSYGDRKPFGDRPQREGYGRDRDDRRDDRRRDDRGGERRWEDRGGNRRDDDRRSFSRRDDAGNGPRDSYGRSINPADLRSSNRPDRERSPEIDEDVTGRELDRGTLGELRSLESRNGTFVAQHLVMAGRYLEEDAELAYQHALAASRRAGRLASVREAVAITAYTAGHYAEALSEFRTFRRISGSNVHLPLMADSERGLGRPDKALELARSEDAQDLDAPGKVELAIVASGAQADKGDFAAALAELEIPQLDINRAFSYSPRLFRAYADALVAAGREDEAARWARQALVAEEALGVGQFAEPEIFDLVGDDEDEERRHASSEENDADSEDDAASDDAPVTGSEDDGAASDDETEVFVDEADGLVEQPAPADTEDDSAEEPDNGSEGESQDR
ncbi:hypothetical protein [Arthrobacter woluwensis]|uniref:hypothetical protein n=1 Tax=Arthrobacter woluwensis TaxID=156980 RepID=UPI001AAEB9FF|nr:hypothetical protein [Arthrobacter woluwensis]QTF71101.1 hypothetical protein G8758_03085 [Arthrobacter woluwensis]